MKASFLAKYAVDLRLMSENICAPMFRLTAAPGLTRVDWLLTCGGSKPALIEFGDNIFEVEPPLRPPGRRGYLYLGGTDLRSTSFLTNSNWFYLSLEAMIKLAARYINCGADHLQLSYVQWKQPLHHSERPTARSEMRTTRSECSSFKVFWDAELEEKNHGRNEGSGNQGTHYQKGPLGRRKELPPEADHLVFCRHQDQRDIEGQEDPPGLSTASASSSAMYSGHA
ncbi:hypothetical protein B0H17DRAFT_1176584 [Mycena rosella]|uniref:Uncharacterized protein n=1 Tax=Mycena rosella TaxID=1033263 RepID=A0AAD7DYH8_MYCRO|nr:hypothetical protein B0H17DRAFT_1176584 [Mycena rosella]